MSSVSPMSPIVSAPIAAEAYGDRVLVSRVLVRRGGEKKEPLWWWVALFWVLFSLSLSFFRSLLGRPNLVRRGAS